MIHRFIGVSGNGEHPPNGNLNAFRMTRNIQKPVDFSNPETPRGAISESWSMMFPPSPVHYGKKFDKSTWKNPTFNSQSGG
jgi:hypothetical protein